MVRFLLVAALLAGCSEYELSEPAGPELGGACDLDGPDRLGPAMAVECATEPVVGSFSPVKEWTWDANPVHPGFDQVMAQPVVGNLTDDNLDGIIDDLDIPDIVFATFSSNQYATAGALVAVSGSSQQTLWSITEVDGHRPYGSTGVAIGDLEADGIPEIVFSSLDGLTAVHPDGTLAWHTDLVAGRYGMPAIADIDSDGVAEVVYGPHVVDAAGQLVWTAAEGGGAHFSSYAADLDGDGLSEVVAGSVVLNHDGSVRFHNPFGNGWTAVGDLDVDGRPEIITVGGGKVGVIDDTGTVIWEFLLTDGGGGPPTVADFDGDGAPEIGVASREVYRVVEGDGTLAWANPVQDYSSSITGSSVFDFEGDGGAEVVYADEETLWVYDGATGAVEMAWTHHSSGTLIEYPVIVDIDLDGSAEILVASNNYAYAGSTGITVVGDADGSWAPARPVWNQHAYSITNIDDDGRVPVTAERNWLRWNSFRAGNSATAAGFDQPDLAVGGPEYCVGECHEDRVVLWVPVTNNASATAWDVQLQVGSQRHALGDITGGTSIWAGPFTITAAEFGESVSLRVSSPGAQECNLADNERSLVSFPCLR